MGFFLFLLIFVGLPLLVAYARLFTDGPESTGK